MSLSTSTSPDEINRAYNTARQYFATHVTKQYTWRYQQLERLLALVSDNETPIADALKKDLNKSHFEGSCFESVIAIQDIKHTMGELKSWMSPISVATPVALLPATSSLVYEPKGTVLIIAPFNYPFQLTLIPLCAALAAGNTVVIKPSEMTPHSTNLLLQLIPKYLDPQAVHVIPGAVAEVQHLLSLKWDHIFFTGSEAIGKIVMKAAAEHLTPCTLELGGKSPTIVDSTADIALAARRISWGKYMNAGQSCIAPDYVFVHKHVHKEFVEAMKQEIPNFYGTNPQTSPDYARIINERHTQRLASIIDAQKDKIVAGGTCDVANKYIAPTILDNVKLNDPSMESELFGPIMPIIEYDHLDNIIKYINERPKPLSLYVFSNDDAAIRTVLEQTSSGGVAINDVMMHFANANLPFGGVGTSGYGVYHGKYGFETFSHAKPILNKSRWLDAPIRYPPYDSTKYALFRYASEIYRVNSESVHKTLKIVFLPLVATIISKRLGITIGFRSKL